MKKMFMSRKELNEFLPWSRNVVGKMIRKGLFEPIRNPFGGPKSKMFFWRPQVEETLESMLGRSCSRKAVQDEQ